MTKTRDTTLPQHNFDQGHYGELPLNSLPSSTLPSGSTFLWDGTNWYFGVAASGSGDGGDTFFLQNDTFANTIHLKAPISYIWGSSSATYASWLQLMSATQAYVSIGSEDNFTGRYVYVSVNGTQGEYYAEAYHDFLWEIDGTLDSSSKHVLLGGNGLVFPILSGDPSGANGQVYYNNASHQFRGYISGSWQDISSSTGSGENSSINFIFDGGGSAITTGIKGDVVIDFNCTIQSVTMLSDQTGDIVVDIWKDTYANYPPDNSDSITASAPPTISSAIKSQDATLTGWTTSISAGDILRFNVDSITSINRCTLNLKVQRT